MEEERVFVGLSGGVDSSVAALRLKQQGYEVVGVFIKVWQPDFLECNWEKERLDAMRVAAHLDIPFLTLDAEADYKREVADYMIKEYQAGRTPNPDVMCNRHIKFGSFLRFAKKHGATKIATGHYARIIKEKNRYTLLRGRDASKDQSYFLWTLKQDELAGVLFPVGDLLKDNVRKEAEEAELPVFGKKDSQGICFLGHIDIKEFLSHYVEARPGDVLDPSGKVIGTHDGSLYYTTGQRHGFRIDVVGKESVPHYVIERDLAANTITVSSLPPVLEKQSSVHIASINRIQKTWKDELSAQFRYRQRPFLVKQRALDAESVSLTILDEGTDSPPKGQSCVLYDGESCVGGGIIV